MLGAHALHNGGGAVLLRVLLPALVPHLKHAFIDTRFAAEARSIMPGVPLTLVPPTLIGRIAALRALPGLADAGDRVFCFNNAPPLGRSRARTILYLRSSFLVPGHPRTRWSPRDRARLGFERLLLRFGQANVDEFWTQTPHMARALVAMANGRPVRILPVFDLPLPGVPPREATARQMPRFFYPAGGWAYKNHAALFRAWALLADLGLRPPLEVTLGPAMHARLLRQAGLDGQDAETIVNLGPIDRARALDRLASADALIFPSETEAFGIPLVEATALGKPIVAAERGYVRDVCVPAQTFDPGDPHSIADAVRRFVGQIRAPVEPLSPEALVKAILA